MNYWTVILLLAGQTVIHLLLARSAINAAKRRGRMEGEVDAIEQIRGQMQAADMRRKRGAL